MDQPRLGRRAYSAIRNDPALQPQSVSFSPEIKPHVAGILDGHWSSNHPPIQVGTCNPYWTLNYFSGRSGTGSILYIQRYTEVGL